MMENEEHIKLLFGFFDVKASNFKGLVPNYLVDKHEKMASVTSLLESKDNSRLSIAALLKVAIDSDEDDDLSQYALEALIKLAPDEMSNVIALAFITNEYMGENIPGLLRSADRDIDDAVLSFMEKYHPNKYVKEEIKSLMKAKKK